MEQGRLNAVILCHVNQHILDSFDMKQLAGEFAQRSNIRKKLFDSREY